MESKMIELVQEVTKYGVYRREQLMDAALGLCGETSEMVLEFIGTDKEKLITEMGDALWYLYSLADGFNLVQALPSVKDMRAVVEENDIMASYSTTELIVYTLTKVCDMADYVKKFTVKGISIEASSLIKLLQFIYVAYVAIAQRAGIDMEEAFNASFEKFKVRYPNGVAGGEVR